MEANFYTKSISAQRIQRRELLSTVSMGPSVHSLSLTFPKKSISLFDAHPSILVFFILLVYSYLHCLLLIPSLDWIRMSRWFYNNPPVYIYSKPCSNPTVDDRILLNEASSVCLRFFFPCFNSSHLCFARVISAVLLGWNTIEKWLLHMSDPLACIRLLPCTVSFVGSLWAAWNVFSISVSVHIHWRSFHIFHISKSHHILRLYI